MDIKELQKIMQENGVVGAGGAGFPTYMKLTDKAKYHSYELCRVRTFTEITQTVIREARLRNNENLPYGSGNSWSF